MSTVQMIERHGTASYADGTPLDRVQCLEAKLILKARPVHFGAELPRLRQDREGYGEEARRWFRRAGLRPEVQEIIFGDTPDSRLHNNVVILRRRISYVDGFPVGDPELVFKFCHPDE